MTHTLHLLNQIEDKLLEYGRQVARISADRTALLAACKELLDCGGPQRRQAARAAIAEAEKPIGERNET